MVTGNMLLGLLAASIILLIVLVSVVKLHAFLSLIICALFLGLTAGKSGEKVVTVITDNVGGVMGSIGLVIVFGVIIGTFLEIIGGAQKIADSIMRLVGKENTPAAVGITGGIVAIPVFMDSGLVILTPIVKSLSRVGRIPIFCLCACIAVGLGVGHVFIPPTPGPVAAAALYGASLGKVLFFGIIVGFASIIVTCLIMSSSYFRKRFPEVVEESIAAVTPEKEAKENTDGIRPVSGGISLFAAYLPIVVPILLIVCQSFTAQYLPEANPYRSFFNFIGRPVVALMVGTAIVWFYTRRYPLRIKNQWIDNALKSIVSVILITCAAGAFGGMIKAIEVGPIFGRLFNGLGIPGVLLPWFVAALVFIATGSGTVSLTTTAGVCAPMLTQLGISPELAVVATCSGGYMLSLPNASGFWLIMKLYDFDMTKTYWAYTLPSCIVSIVSLLFVFLLRAFGV